MASLDLTAIGIKPGPVLALDAHVQVFVDSGTGKVTIHIDDKIGPLTGPTLDAEIDPIHALHLVAVGVGRAIGNIFAKKQPAMGGIM